MKCFQCDRPAVGICGWCLLGQCEAHMSGARSPAPHSHDGLHPPIHWRQRPCRDEGGWSFEGWARLTPAQTGLEPLAAGWTAWEAAGTGAAAFVGATLAAVSGFGGAAVLLPVLVAAFGPRLAVPILTVAQLVGNGSRVWFNRRAVDYRVVGWFALGGVPLAVAGGILFATAPLHVLTRVIGAFLVLVVLWRRLRPGVSWRLSLKSFAGIGAVSSLLSAIVGSVGPLMAPLFLAYGLVKGAYIGTEACATVVMHVTKLAVYRQAAVLPNAAVLAGLALGPLMIAGSWLGHRIVDRMPERVFVAIIELTMVVAGLLFLIKG